jgi:hypothetical protein
MSIALSLTCALQLSLTITPNSFCTVYHRILLRSSVQTLSTIYLLTDTHIQHHGTSYHKDGDTQGRCACRRRQEGWPTPWQSRQEGKCEECYDQDAGLL